MERPTVSAITELVYQELEPINFMDERTGYATLLYLDAHMRNLQDIYDLVRDDPDRLMPGWAVLFDPARAPASALPYAAQFVGRVLHPYLSEYAMRQRFANPDFKRG